MKSYEYNGKKYVELYENGQKDYPLRGEKFYDPSNDSVWEADHDFTATKYIRLISKEHRLKAPSLTISPEELTALRESITEKWDGVLDGTEKDEGHRNCPLCILHNSQCNHCIVTQDSTAIDCRQIGYHDWYDHTEKVHKDCISTDNWAGRIIYCPECKKLAQTIRDNLQGILEKVEAEKPKEFVPVSLLIETEEELGYLWHLANEGYATFKKNYFKKGYEVAEDSPPFPAEKPFGLWKRISRIHNERRQNP